MGKEKIQVTFGRSRSGGSVTVGSWRVLSPEQNTGEPCNASRVCPEEAKMFFILKDKFCINGGRTA